MVPFAAVGTFLWQVPDFYRIRAHQTEYSPERSDSFFSRGTRFINKVYNAEGRWDETFDETDLNAWLVHDFNRHLSRSLPHGLSEPRVAFESGEMKLGFRWGFGPLNTVVHVNLRTWVPKNNVMALELCGAWAGALPLPTTYVRNVFEKVAEAGGLEMTWHRNRSKLIGLVKVPVPRSGKYVTLRRAEIGPKTFKLAGQNLQATAMADKAAHTR
jgi:hypothetical protein